MKEFIKINELETIVFNFCYSLGYSKNEAISICENVIEAELRGKYTHGLWRLLIHKSHIAKTGKPSELSIEFKKVTHNSMLVDGKQRTGYHVMNKALDIAIKNCKTYGIYTFSLTNTAPSLGIVGLYANKVTSEDLIYIGFSNSEGGLIPFSSKKDIFGTNPITIGVPTKKSPIIADMSSSILNWGDVYLRDKDNKKLPPKVALDKEGNFTENPKDVLNGGGLLPLGGNKGSSLAFIIEIIAGVLTSSRAGQSLHGGWGNLSILLNPSIFIDINEFKDNIEKFIIDYKETPSYLSDLFYPGEQSFFTREKNIKLGSIQVDSNLLKQLKNN